MRVRGNIAAVAGHTVAVRNRDGQDLWVVLVVTTAIAAVQAPKLSDIKAGDGVGATTRPGEWVFFGAEKAADGTLTPTGRIQVSRDGVKPPL